MKFMSLSNSCVYLIHVCISFMCVSNSCVYLIHVCISFMCVSNSCIGGGSGGAGGAAAPTKFKVWGHSPHNRSQYFTSL